MAEYDDTNKGAFFRNEEKMDANHPDYNGSINVEGKEYWLNGWIKMSKAGKKFMSLSVKPKQPKGAAPTGRKAAPVEDDSDIPF
jgi:uncharacterized protein (DUF736 family)